MNEFSILYKVTNQAHLRNFCIAVKYMKAQVGPASKECKTKEDLDKLLAKPEVVVVCYGKDDQDGFLKVANALRETVAFGHTEVGDKKGVVLHRPKVMIMKYLLLSKIR